MRSWIKPTLLVMLLLALCWAGTVAYWRTTNHLPSSSDLVIYLLVLPVLLLSALLLGRGLVGLIGPAPALAFAAPGAAPGQASAPATLDAQHVPPLAILACALRSPHGASPAELAAALAANTARADLDPELVNEDGFPVMTARHGDPGDEAVQDEVREWLAEQGMGEVRFEPEQWRALALGSSVVEQLCAQAASSLLLPDAVPPTLHLLPLLPQEWHMEARSAAGMWLRHKAVSVGWPDGKLALAAELPMATASPVDAMARLAIHGAATEAPVLALIIACASHVGDDSISTWSGKGVLFSAKRPQGLVPGEGAAGLLLLDQEQAARIDSASPMLHMVNDARRHNSADEAKRADADLLAVLADKLLLNAKSGALDVAMLVADTGHRTSRVLELMGLAGKTLPELDKATDVVSLGPGCGTCGAVPFMTALAMASHYALERSAPVLCISNEDPYRRSAVLVRPALILS